MPDQTDQCASSGPPAAYGFGYCPPFGDYRPDSHSVFMTRAL
ncbi:hypothetical protein [Nocardia sp. NPDC005745]